MALITDTIEIYKTDEYKELITKDKERDVLVIDKNGNYERNDNVRGVIKSPKTNTIKAGTKIEIDDYIKDNNLEQNIIEAIKLF